MIGALAGGGFALLGSSFEGRRERAARRRDRRDGWADELTEQVVALHRAAVEAGEKRSDRGWRPTKYEGICLRISALTGRIGDGRVRDATAEMLRRAEITGSVESIDELVAAEQELRESGEAVNAAVAALTEQ